MRSCIPTSTISRKFQSWSLSREGFERLHSAPEVPVPGELFRGMSAVGSEDQRFFAVVVFLVCTYECEEFCTCSREFCVWSWKKKVSHVCVFHRMTLSNSRVVCVVLVGIEGM